MYSNIFPHPRDAEDTEDEDRVGDGAPCRRTEYIMSYGRFHGGRKCW